MLPTRRKVGAGLLCSFFPDLVGLTLGYGADSWCSLNASWLAPVWTSTSSTSIPRKLSPDIGSNNLGLRLVSIFMLMCCEYELGKNNNIKCDRCERGGSGSSSPVSNTIPPLPSLLTPPCAEGTHPPMPTLASCLPPTVLLLPMPCMSVAHCVSCPGHTGMAT